MDVRKISPISNLQRNCNGIYAHQNELSNYLAVNRNKYDVICLQEKFLKPEKSFSLPGYNVVRRNRIKNGGLLTSIKDTINYTEIRSPNSIERQILNIKSLSSYLRIVNIYLPPNKPVNKMELNSLFERCTLITGDINAKSKLWGSPCTNERGLMIEDLIDMNNASVINTGQPTYQHYDGSRSHLDVSNVDSVELLGCKIKLGCAK